jgi:uncharacterized protein
MKRTATWLSPIWTIVWKSLLFFILWGILLAPFIVPFATRIEQARQTSPLQLQLVADVCTALTLLASAWILAHFIDRRSFVSLGFSPDHWIRDLLQGLGLGTVWLALSVAVLWLAGSAEARPAGVMSMSVLAWTGAALIFNTVAQEVLARSYIFQTIRSQTNATVAVIVTAILFMAYHAGAYHGSWLPACNVFAAGILFGMAYQLTGNLWLPMGIHFIWNFLVGPVLGLSVSGNTQLRGGWQLLTLQGPDWLTGGAFGLEGGLAVTLTTILGIVVFFVLTRGRRLRTSGLASIGIDP